MDLPRIVDPPDGSVVREWVSPRFAAPAPVLRNAGLIPAEIRAMMAPCWDTRWFPPRPAQLHRLRDVFVVGEGLVFDRDLRVVGPSMTQHTLAEAAAARDTLRAAMVAGTVIEDRGTTLLCQKRGMANFGHWLIELLPMAYLCLGDLGDGGWRVLVPSGAGAMDGVVRDSLALIGVPPDAVRWGDGSPRHVEELLLLHGLTSHGYTISPLVMGCMHALMGEVPAAGRDRLWVSRRGTVRRLWNEEEVERVLAGLGWRVLQPEALPFRDQVAAFRGAAAVAGVAGAGLTGLVFAAPGTPVTTFTPARMPDTFFWLLSVLRGHRYTEVRAPHDRGWAGMASYDAPLVLSLPQVLQQLGAH